MVLNIGCPVWACDHWRGSLFTAKASREDWLKQYSSVFSTVEGNSTFYAIPKPSIVQRWVDSVARDFHFALKFPRVISHDPGLRDSGKETGEFVDLLNILDAGRKLGPSFLQLPPDFSPDQFSVLEKYLRALPAYLPWAVEVRHHDWYDSGINEWRLDELLRDLGIDKVIFDSRPLFSRPPADEIEVVSQKRKPRTPVRRTVTGKCPFLRIVGRNQLSDVTPWIEEWAPVIADWLQQGLTPYIFTHAPDDRFAPEFARMLHNRIRSFRPELPPMPPWPGEKPSGLRHVQRPLFE